MNEYNPSIANIVDRKTITTQTYGLYENTFLYSVEELGSSVTKA